jgi:hypothetical protein
VHRGSPDQEPPFNRTFDESNLAADERRRRLSNDKAVPLLSGAPPQVCGRDSDNSHVDDIV